jgi:hypothetical protein
MAELFNKIKKHRFDVLVTCSVIAFLCDVYLGIHIFSISIIALYALGYAADREGSRTNIVERKKFIPRGLVKEDLKNIEFVKAWYETRKIGLVRFSIIYGGVIFGLVLCFVISLFIMLMIKGVLKYISVDPANMLNFIGYTYVAGIVAGTVFYRLLWSYNEQKFIRLTDPLH